MAEADWMRPGTLAYIERHAIIDAIRECDQSITAAARRLCIGRTTIYRLINRYEIPVEKRKNLPEVGVKRSPKAAAGKANLTHRVVHKDGNFYLVGD